MKLLDTSIVVDHLRGYVPATELIERCLVRGETVAASELTRFELLAGVREAERAELEDFFTVVDWVPTAEEIARRAGAFARTYRRSHSGIDAADYLIAATAAALQTEPLTTNVRHFPMFPGLQPPYRYE